MKSLVFIICFLVSLQAISQSLVEARESFHQAVLDPDQSRAFHNFFKNTTPNTPTLKAYKATSEAMLARVVWNPFTKLSQVMKYSELMETAVLEDQENIEIRFLRLSIEYNLPKFLGMSKNMTVDRDTIVSNLSTVNSMDLDPSFCRYIIYFLNDTGLCTEEEMLLMENVLTSSNSSPGN